MGASSLYVEREREARVRRNIHIGWFIALVAVGFLMRGCGKESREGEVRELQGQVNQLSGLRQQLGLPIVPTDGAYEVLICAEHGCILKPLREGNTDPRFYAVGNNFNAAGSIIVIQDQRITKTMRPQ